MLNQNIYANKEYAAGTVPANKEYAAGTLSNVRRCWLAMPLGAGILHWVLACRTIEKQNKLLNFNLKNIFLLNVWLCPGFSVVLSRVFCPG